MKAKSIISVLALSALCYTIVSCKKTTGEAGVAENEETVDLAYSDTLRYEIVRFDSTWDAKEEFLSHYTLGIEARLEVPSSEQNPALAKSIMKWACGNISASYEGDPTDAMALLYHHVDQHNDEYNKFELVKEYEAGDYVSYVLNGYTYYAGAAHGLPFFRGATFRKSDGSHVGLLGKDCKDEFDKLVREGLMEYFEVKTVKELDHILMVEYEEEGPNRYLPEPNTTWITDKGLAFLYEPYEIASFADGMPTAIIPMEKAAAVLSPEAKKMLGL